MVGAHQVVLERLGGLHARPAHVGHAGGEVERHDRPRVNVQPAYGSAPDQVPPAGVRPVRFSGDGDGDHQPGITSPQDDQRADHPLPYIGGGDLRVLRIQVDGMQPVGADDLLVGVRQRLR